MYNLEKLDKDIARYLTLAGKANITFYALMIAVFLAVTACFLDSWQVAFWSALGTVLLFLAGWSFQHQADNFWQDVEKKIRKVRDTATFL